MSFNYGINRLLDLQETNFQVFDMDVKEDKITYTIKHKEPAQYICKHCGHAHDSYHDKEWVCPIPRSLTGFKGGKSHVSGPALGEVNPT